MPDPWNFVFGILALFILLPTIWSWQLALHFFRHSRKTAVPMTSFPRTAVILSLRGADPSLNMCLEGLLRQDYPNYCLWIIVDSREDPAWNKVHEVLAGHPELRAQVNVEVLEQRQDQCSLKVSSQLQAISELDDSFEIVAVIDADSIPARNWLRYLVEPFTDPRVGASTGIRWFCPPDSGWGVLVRHLYNAASFTQMFVFHIPWGGSLAFRFSLLRESNLLDFWSHCFCEDTSAYGTLRAHRRRLVFVPEVTQVNRETIALGSCYQFILRQLLCVRLHHVHWASIFLTNAGTFVALAVATGMLGFGLLTQAWDWVAASAGLIGGFTLGLFGALTLGEWSLKRIFENRGETFPALSFTWRIFPAGLLTQVLSIQCMIRVLFLRRIRWRGVEYAIHGPDNIRLLEYHPYVQDLQKDTTHSIV